MKDECAAVVAAAELIDSGKILYRPVADPRKLLLTRGELLVGVCAKLNLDPNKLSTLVASRDR